MQRPVLALLTSLVLVVACRAQAISDMAKTTVLVDEQFSAAYEAAAELCLENSDTRPEYDSCVERWDTAADAVRANYDASRVLDVAKGRDFRRAGCAWFRSLAVVEATSPVTLPAVTAGLSSKWRKRCSK